MRRLAPIVMLLLVSACEKTSEPAAATGEPAKTAESEPAKTVEPTPAEAKPDTKQEPERKIKTKPEPLTPEQASSLGKQYRNKLDQGRALTKAGKHGEGIELYREILAIEPSNPTVLAELGWAALQANQLDVAQGATSQALTYSRKPEQQGMILYNLGRIAEARGQTNDAIAHYRESLVRRSNKTVQARLDGLLAAATTPPPTPPTEGIGQIFAGISELDAVCKQLADEECDNLFTIEEDACACDVYTGDEDEGWVLLELGESNAVDNYVWFPAIRTSSGWVVMDAIAWLYNPGAFGIWEEGDWGPQEWKDLLPGGDPEWVLTFTKNRSDTDMGLNEYETVSSTMTVICAREGAQAWCTRPLVSSFSYERDVEFEVEDEVEQFGEALDHEGLPIKESFSCALELGAKIVVSDVVGAMSNDWDGRALPAGEHDLAALMGKPTSAAPADAPADGGGAVDGATVGLLPKSGLHADVPTGKTSITEVEGSDMVVGANLVVAVEPGDDKPKTGDKALAAADTHKPKDPKVETLPDGYILTFTSEGSLGLNYWVNSRRTIGGTAYWCTTTASTPEQRDAAVAFCKSLRK